MPSSLSISWLIPVGPFLAFAVISLWAHRYRVLSQVLSIAGILASVVFSQLAFWSTVRTPDVFHSVLLQWLELGTEHVGLGVYLDPTAAVLAAMVSFVCLMIFLYSIGYMRGDEKISRFFAYISLFAGAMLGAAICDNLLALFLFWEIMGTCSYLLIGFWWERKSAVKAALKAFIVTKIGDLFLLLGLVLLYAQVGSLAYADVFNATTVARLAQTPYIGQLTVATVAGLLLFGGTVGKSAQLPLHVWLPDAMEGPTPVSALIHAATMVSAGIYLLVRAFPLLVASQALPAVALVGTLTAVYASVVAIAQNDIKRVLAFSTISQLGYMVAAIGIGAYTASFFHLITHAFFKSLLFLAAGSVIHGIEHGHHHTRGHAAPVKTPELDFSPNDMRRMGGLAFRMPATALTFLAGGLALSGFPLISAGFWSKDAILAQAWGQSGYVFWGLLFAAGLTAFYTARQVCMTFLGKPRSRAAVYARESALVMTVPLGFLAIFAVSLGWLGIPSEFPVLGKLLPDVFGPFVETSLARIGAEFAGSAPGEPLAWQPMILAVSFALGGLFLGWWVYGRRAGAANASEEEYVDPLQRVMERVRLGWFYRAMERRFYIDGLYEKVFSAPAIWLADTLHLVDRDAIDAPIVAFGQGFGKTGRVAPTAGRQERGLFDQFADAISLFSRLLSSMAVTLDERLIDGLVNAVGRLGRGFSNLFGLLDSDFIDGAVRAISDATGALGRWMRRMQSGLLPDYLWNAFMIILLLVAALVLFQRI